MATIWRDGPLFTQRFFQGPKGGSDSSDVTVRLTGNWGTRVPRGEVIPPFRFLIDWLFNAARVELFVRQTCSRFQFQTFVTWIEMKRIARISR